MEDLWTKIKQWSSDHVWLLFAVALAVVIAIFWLLNSSTAARPAEAGSGWIFSTVVKVLLLIFAVWFILIFTGDATKRKLEQMVAFSYLFPFWLVALIIAPFFLYPEGLPNPPKPIGLVLGCNWAPAKPANRELVPDGISCDNWSDQWLVNIGGDAVERDQFMRLKSKRDAEKADADAKANADADAKVKADAAIKANANADAKANANADAKAKADADAKAKADADAKAKTDADAKAKVDANAKAKVESDAKAKADADVRSGVTTAGPTHSVKRSNAETYDVGTRFVVTGGLVVPLYYVILAVFGGFVSMLRKVPEYQERVTSSSDHLTNELARENLVFQVLQLIAAPIIAITAYYLVEPSSRATSIALAFIAGFSSETVLLYVRALTEKLQPETTRTAREVDVEPRSLDFPGQKMNAQSAAQIVKLTNHGVNALTATVTISGDFNCDPKGTLTVEPGSSKSFNVTFKPTKIGKHTEELRITDSAPGSPRVVSLNGDVIQNGNAKQ